MNSNGGPPFLHRTLLSRLRPNSEFPNSANDYIVKLQCNLTKEFEGRAPPIAESRTAGDVSANREFPSFIEVYIC